MALRRKSVLNIRNYNFPPTKLRHVFCTQCKHQFYLEEFVHLLGMVPLLLDCGHVICNNCAKSFANKPCTICKIPLECEKTALLPLNIYALGLVVMSQNRPVSTDDADISFSKSINAKFKPQRINGLCHECGIEAAIKCPQCSALYCVSCYSKIHGRALQNHSKIMLSEGKDENSFNVQNTCSERCNESLGYYCENCDIAGCSHCMLRSHNRHNYQPLLHKNKKLLLEFRNVIKRVEMNLQRVQQAQKKIQSTLLYPADTHNVHNVEAAVTQHFTHLHGILQNVERKIIDSLQEQRSSRTRNVEEISRLLAGHESRLRSALMITDSVSKNLDKINVQQVINKLETLVDIPCYLVSNSASEDQEIKLNIDKSIVDVIKKHCTVEIPEAPCFSLQRIKSLPDDYEIEPLAEEVTISQQVEMAMNETSTVSLPPAKHSNGPVIGGCEMVNVSHVVDPSCFYVQLNQNKHKLAELTSGIADLANTYGTIPKEVTLNALYIVQHSVTRVWYRARVMNIEVDSQGVEKYNVIFIDHGMGEENVPLSRIRNIVPQYAMFPVMALRCTLYDVAPKNNRWHADAIKAFNNLIHADMMTSMSTIMITGDTYYVDLCVVSSKDSRLISVRDSLTYMGYATCVSPHRLMRMNPGSTKNWMEQKYYKEQLEMHTYTDVRVLFVESPYAIYVQKKHANRSHFMRLMRELTADYEENVSVAELIPTPYKNMPCAARGINGSWHRGSITEVSENTVTVFYVDVGYTLILNHADVRALSKKYMSCKAQAIKTSLRNIKPCSKTQTQWDPEATQFLNQSLMNSRSLRAIPFDKFKDSYDVVMYTEENNSVANLLVQEGLAMFIDRYKHQRNTCKKYGKNTGLLGQLYDSPLNTSIGTKSVQEAEDPFKVCVEVHHAHSPDSIYVSEAVGNRSDVEHMMKQMQNFYSKYRSEKRDVWNKNDVCVIYSSRSGMYCRGKIVDIKSPEKAVVFLYDVGIEETVPVNDIQSLYPMYSKVSTLVFKIKLSGILPCGGSNTWPTFSCEKLQEIISNNQNSKFYISKIEDEEAEDSIPVELWIKQVKMDGPLEPTRHEINSVNRMLVEEGVALPVKEYAKKRDRILAIEFKKQLMRKLERLTKSEPNVKWFEINRDLDDFLEADVNKEGAKNQSQTDIESDGEDSGTDDMYHNFPSLPVVSNWNQETIITADVFIAIPTYLDHDGFLYLHSKTENSEILQYIEHKLERLYGNSQIESCDTVWAAGDMCIAQYHANKKWYRAKVLQVLENDTIQVEFVDYGNVEECPIGTLKKKVILEDIPVQCTKCLVQGLVPGTENGKWALEDLDRIHTLIIEQECEVTVIDRLNTHLVISLTILPNSRCKKKCDLIKFLRNNWKMNIKPDAELASLETSVSTADTPDVVIGNCGAFISDDEILTDTVITGNSVLRVHDEALNKNDSVTITDTENISWRHMKEEIVTSTPFVASEENLSMIFKAVEVPNDVEYIEIELCCSLSPTKFYAQLKENAHSAILNTYYTLYENLMIDLQNYASMQPMITSFAVNTPCCAKFEDNLWYRCLIVESEPDTQSEDVEVKLLYIDYGNNEYRKVNLKQCDLRVLKKEWFDVPTMAKKCVLSNIKVASTVNYKLLITQLQNMYGKRVVATIKNDGEEFWSVELYENSERKELLYSNLIEEGLFLLDVPDN